MQINEKKITKSRYNDERILTRISENEYILEGNSRYARGGVLNDGAKFFDLEGGPFYAVGDKILDSDDERRIIDFEGIETDKKNYEIIKLTVA